MSQDEKFSWLWYLNVVTIGSTWGPMLVQIITGGYIEPVDVVVVSTVIIGAYLVAWGTRARYVVAKKRDKE